MNPNRRRFLQLSALWGAGASLLPLQFCAAPKKEEALAANSKLDRFGIQLYSVKEDMALDSQGTIRTLASYGYKQLEGFDGGNGILWGMEPRRLNRCSLNWTYGWSLPIAMCLKI